MISMAKPGPEESSLPQVNVIKVRYIVVQGLKESWPPKCIRCAVKVAEPGCKDASPARCRYVGERKFCG
jgi:hypothetical protein